MRVKKLPIALLFASLAALPCFSQTKSTLHEQIQSHIRLAQKYLSEGKPELAVPELKKIIALDPKNVDARGNLGVLLFFQRQYAQAVPQLHAALKLQPGLWKIQALLGLAEIQLGKEEEGRMDLATAFPHIQDEKIKSATSTALRRSSRPC